MTHVTLLLLLLLSLSPARSITEGSHDAKPIEKDDAEPLIAPPDSTSPQVSIDLHGFQVSLGGLSENFTSTDVFEYLTRQWAVEGVPGNMSDIYKGRWIFVDSSDNATLDKNVAVSKKTGDILMQIRDMSGVASWGTLVFGDAVLRDGKYITDHSVRLVFKGVHFTHAGLLMVQAHTVPVAMTAVVDYDELFAATQNLTALKELALDLIDSLHTPAVHPNAQECAFLLVARTAKIRTKVSLTSGSMSSEPALPSDMEFRAQAFHGALGSADCGVAFMVQAETVVYSELFSKITLYLAMATVIAFVQAYFVMKQLVHASSASVAARTSLLTIGMQAVMDSYMCLAHLTLGVTIEPVFNSAATASLLEFIVFSVFEMRLLITIWKAQRPDRAGEGWEVLRRELAALYARFYLALILGIVLIYQLSWAFLMAIMFLMMGFWVPQIIMNIRRGSIRPFAKNYVYGMSITRLIIPLYFLLCPVNFLHLEPQPVLATAMVLFVAAQVAILVLQDRHGPAFFIPARFLPPKYDYHRALPGSVAAAEYPDAGNIQGEGGYADVEAGGAVHIECTICMQEVDTSNRSAYMLTPCNHLFHSACLLRWMEIKLECPTCRQVLELP